MPEPLYDVVFSGQLTGQASPAAVQQAIQALFRLDDAHTQQLFSGRRVAIKRGVDLSTAKRFQAAFHEAGALVEIEPQEEPEVIFAAPPPDDDDSVPPALVDDTEQTDPSATATVPPAADGAALTLAPAGTPLDEIDDRGPPRSPDTSRLSLLPETGWTLEDCAPAVEAATVPSTGALALEPIDPRPDADRRGGDRFDTD
jgi:hypothetical protein